MGAQLLYTEEQVCDAIQQSRSSLRRLIARGVIRPVHIGRSIRFPAQEIERFVAELQEGSAAVNDEG